MTALQSTFEFESDLRHLLLDLVFSQWHDLGIPFSDVQSSVEVIDLEALIWCSLEFLPFEPRLCENVVGWLHRHNGYVIRQRLRARAKGSDPRGQIWRLLDPITPPNSTLAEVSPPAQHTPPADAPSPLKHYRFPHLNSAHGKRAGITRHSPQPVDYLEFARHLEEKIDRHPSASARVGEPLLKPSTILLSARDLLGNDSHHFLLLFLLARPGGGRLRDVARWSGYSYRAISDTAERWERAGTVVIDHGYCRLRSAAPWRALLRSEAEPIVLVDFFRCFEACVELLRLLGKVREKNLGWDSSPATAFRRDAVTALSSCVLSHDAAAARGVNRLLDLFPMAEKAGMIVA